MSRETPVNETRTHTNSLIADESGENDHNTRFIIIIANRMSTLTMIVLRLSVAAAFLSLSPNQHEHRSRDICHSSSLTRKTNRSEQAT